MDVIVAANTAAVQRAKEAREIPNPDGPRRRIHDRIGREWLRTRPQGIYPGLLVHNGERPIDIAFRTPVG